MELNKIQIEIAGDSTLENNVKQAKEIEIAINNAYEKFQKMGSGISEEIITDFKKMTKEAENYKNSIVDILAKEKLHGENNSKNNTDFINDIKKREQFRKEIDSAEKNRINNEKINLEQLKVTMDGYFREKEANQKKEIELNKKTIQSTKEITVENEKSKIEYQKTGQAIKKQAQNEIDLINIEKKEIKSLDDLKNRVSALKRVRDGLDSSTSKGRAEFKRLTTEINKYNNALKSADERAGFFQRNVGNYKSALSALKTGWMGVAGAIGAGIAIIKGAITAIVGFVDAYNEGALLETKLTTILKERTGASDSQIKSIIKLTEAQQSLGVVEQEVQLAGLQQLSTFVKKTESVEALLPAMNNLLVQQNGLNATTGDAVNIANLFGKAMDGNASALRKVGITFTESQEKIIKFGTETERAAILSQVITDNVGEMNKAFAATDAGKIQQTKNELGDMMEEIGEQLQPLLADFFETLLKSVNIIKQIAIDFGLWKDEVEKISVAQERLNSSEKQFDDIMSQEKVKIESLILIAKNEKRTKNERLNAIKQLNEISPEYLGNIKLETINTEAATIAVDNYVKSLETKIKSQIASENITQIMTEQVNLEIKQQEFLIKNQKKIAEMQSQGVDLLDIAQKEKIKGYINEEEKANFQILSQISNFEQQLLSLEKEKENYLKIVDELGIGFGGFEKEVTDANLGDAVEKIDIFAKKVDEINKEILKKQLELKRQYKKDNAKIEEELLNFQQSKQLELLKFIEEYKLTDKKIEEELKYIELSEKIKADELEKEKLNNEKKIKIFDEYIELKKLGFEKEILLAEKNKISTNEIELRKLEQQKEILLEQQKFLIENNASEKELAIVENNLLQLENQYARFIENLKEISKSDENWLLNYLHLTKDELQQYKQGFATLYGAISDFTEANINEKIDATQLEIDLIDLIIDKENEKIDGLRDNLNNENELREKNVENNALFIESQIRASEELIQQKEIEQQRQIELKEKEERKLRAIQKTQIYVQFAIDNASAISSIIKYAMQNPLNAPTGGLAGIGQIALMTAVVVANFIKAQAAVKMLKKGEVGINEGSGTKDDVPALLMRGESVITQKGTKTAPNLLRGLNKGASTTELLSLLYKDLGMETLNNFVVSLNSQPFEIQKQNKELLEQNEILKKSNNALNLLIELEKNKPSYIPMKNGYKKITQNKVEIIKFS
jgi:hypothetical protein